MDYSNKHNSDFWLFVLISDNEKLKAKVADYEVYITKLLEEKTQAEKQKQIITG